MSFVQKMERAVRDLERCFPIQESEKLREEAQRVYTTADFVTFKTKYSLLRVQAAYARQIVRVIDRQLRYADLGKKEDLFSVILMDEKQGINRALSSFDPEKVSLACKLCEESSSTIIDNNDFYVKDGKKFHKADNGELVCKSLNSWIVDFIYYPTKGPDRDAMKRSRFREYNCPKCGTPALEKTKNKVEEMTCEECSSVLGKTVTFEKSNELKSRKSYYNTEVHSISSPFGDEDGPTLDQMLSDNGNDAEESILRARANQLIDKLEKLIAQWTPRKSGIFKNSSSKESEVFRLLIPEDFLFSDHEIMKMTAAEFQLKVPKSSKALGIIVAGKAGRIYPYAVCQDCGKKYDLGKNWEKNFAALQLQRCTSEAVEHRTSWTDQVYDKARALNDVTYQHRIGYERALEAGSNSDVFCDFKEDKTVKPIPVGTNYEERRLLGQNLELHSYTNGFSDIGDDINIPLPTGYLGKKEHIDLYLFQAANRWMGKLRTNCPHPNCRKEIDELNEAQEAGTPKGEMTCPHCGYKWNLREGDFLKRIKTSPQTNKLYQELMDTLRQILKLRVESKDPIISVSRA